VSYTKYTGTSTANTLLGSSGADSIAALAGNDTVLVNGNDLIYLDAGDDSLSMDSNLTSGTVYGEQVMTPLTGITFSAPLL